MAVLRSLFFCSAIALIAWLALSSVQKQRITALERLREQVEELGLKCKWKFEPGGRLRVRGRKAYSPTVMRGAYRSPRNLCEYSERAITHFLARPHNCSRLGTRVWLQGEWMDSARMEALLAAPAAEAGDPIKCAVFCVDRAAPCPQGQCLLPVYMRRNSTDAKVAAQILEGGDFDVVKPHMELRHILDAGAGIGVSSLVLATMLPEARIVSVEASPESYQILLLNARSYPRILPLNAGLWPRVTRLQLTAATPGRTRLLAENAKIATTSVNGLSVGFLLNLFKIAKFDFVKLDIAGNEKEVLTMAPNNPLKWLDGAKMAMVSIHEKLKRGSKDAVTKAFSDSPRWRYLGLWKKYRVYKAKGFDEN